jgi:hypothetical protein
MLERFVGSSASNDAGKEKTQFSEKQVVIILSCKLMGSEIIVGFKILIQKF